MDGHHVWSIGVVRSTWHWRPLEVDGEGRSVRHVEGVDELLSPGSLMLSAPVLGSHLLTRRAQMFRLKKITRYQTKLIRQFVCTTHIHTHETCAHQSKLIRQFVCTTHTRDMHARAHTLVQFSLSGLCKWLHAR